MSQGLILSPLFSLFSVLEEQMNSAATIKTSLHVNCHDAISRKANRILGLMRIRKDIRGWKDIQDVLLYDKFGHLTHKKLLTNLSVFKLRRLHIYVSETRVLELIVSIWF